MRIILVSCFLLSTCSLTLATEYVEGVYDLQPSKKDKRFIFNKQTNIQRLIQGLTAFSSISNSNKNVPLPPPVKSTPAPSTVEPPATTSDGSEVALAISDYSTTTAAPGKNNDFDNELDQLTQYHDNTYALPETAPRSGLSQSKVDRLPPLPQKQDTDVKTVSSPQSYNQSKNNDFDNELDQLTQYHDNTYALPETAPRSGLSQSKVDRLPPLPQKQGTDVKTVSSPQSYNQSKNNDFDNELDQLTQYHDNTYALPETAPRSGQSQSKVDRLPPLPQKQDTDVKTVSSPQAYNQSFYTSPQQFTSAGLSLGTVDTVPLTYSHSQIYSQPLPYLSHQTQVSFFPESTYTYLPQQHVIPASQISPLTFHAQQQTHLSYVSPVYTSIPTTSYDQYQSLSNNHFSFSNQLLNSAHFQTAYYGNTQYTGSQCAWKDYKK